MKKIIKRLGVLGLLLAVLIPFLDLPVVKAEDCKTYLNVYFLLDQFGGSAISVYDGEGHRNFSTVDYGFPANAKITKVSKKPFGNNDNAYTEFYNIYNEVANSKNISLNATNSSNTIATDGANLTFSNLNQYAATTYFIHGQWGELSTSTNNKYVSGVSSTPTDLFFENHTNLKMFEHDGLTGGQGLKEKSIQYFISNGSNKLKNVGISSALGLVRYTGTYTQGNVQIGSGSSFASINPQTNSYGDNDFMNYVNNTVFAHFDDSVNNGIVIKAADGTYKLNIGIDRRLSGLNNLTYGWEDKSVTPSKYYIFTTTASPTTSADIANSFEAIKAYYYGNTSGYNLLEVATEKEFTDLVDFNMTAPDVIEETINSKIVKDDSYYWPEEYFVEYQVCNTTVVNPEKYKVEYNANTDDTTVKNLPETTQHEKDEKIKISDGASRDNYKFVKWCTSKDGTSGCVDPGDEYTVTGNVIFYAQWGKTGTGDNAKTGITSYILGFAAIGLITSGIYLVSKKKNLFKQI